MSGKKDQAVVAIISGLTRSQASSITADIFKSKAKHAPLSRGTAASGLISNISGLLQGGSKKIGG